jgi:hypothetical protein
VLQLTASWRFDPSPYSSLSHVIVRLWIFWFAGFFLPLPECFLFDFITLDLRTGVGLLKFFFIGRHGSLDLSF